MTEVKHHVALFASQRIVPAIILAVSVLACLAYAAATSKGVGAESHGEEADLEKAIAVGCAGTETWMAYAGILQSRGECEYAAEAYRKVLEKAPFDRTAQLELSVCLASAGRDLELKELLSDLALNDAKLAVEIMGRQELVPYMEGSDFAKILSAARDQAND